MIRLGGDEFIALVRCPDAETLRRLGQRLNDAAEREGVMPFSLGIAFNDLDESISKALVRADRAMYREKRSRARGARRG